MDNVNEREERGLRGQRFRKKPVLVEAFQWTEARRLDNAEWPHWLGEAWNRTGAQRGSFFIISPGRGPGQEGEEMALILADGRVALVRYGEWIVRDERGGLSSLPPEVFAETFEAVGA